MSTYGTLLKTLINFSGSKLSTVAEEVGYDVSYISKWCNKAKLPAAKMAPNINRTLAAHFASEILKHEDLSSFSKVFSVDVNIDSLESTIYNLLKDSYNQSINDASVDQTNKAVYQTRVLSLANDVHEFFNHELIETILSYDEPLEVLCTLDICRYLSDNVEDATSHVVPNHDINVKIGLNTERFFSDTKTNLTQFYYFLNAHVHISFDFYDDCLMNSLNAIIIKDHMAILCALDQYNRIQTAVVITDPEKVNQIYIRTLPAYRNSNLLLHATDSDEFYQHGYRTDFYARDNYQILLTRGFEYLLPVECWESITRTARERDQDEFMAQLVAQLQITWEEIFEKNTLDFYVLKSSLLKYMEDGEIIFADIVYNMTPEERKLHIEKVLDITKINQKINFHVIDEELLPNVQHLLNISVFNNRKKLFLKIPGRYHRKVGPRFYSVLSDQFIRETSQYLDDIKNSSFCLNFDAEGIQKFYDKYGSLICRMIDLSPLKQTNL